MLSGPKQNTSGMSLETKTLNDKNEISMPKKKTAKKKAGRPSQYKSRFCRMLIKFFDVEPFTEVKVPVYDESGKTYKRGIHKDEKVVTHFDVKRNPNRLPTLQQFAKKIHIGISTVYDWLNKDHASYHQEFSDAFACARDLRKNFLIENGLHGCHQHSYAKFVATNLTDMKDTQKQEITGEDGGPVKAKVEVIHFDKANIDNNNGGSPDTD